MIVCPNCNHQNPEGSTQCENCYTPLPQTTSCPNCGASVQTDATFCGQCGFNLQVEMIEPIMDMSENLEEYPELTYTEETESLESVPTEAISPSLQSPWDEDEDEDSPVTKAQETTPWPKETTEDKGLEQSQSVTRNPWDIEEPAEELLELATSEEELLDLANSIEGLNSSNSGKTESTEELFSSTPSLREELKELSDLPNQEDLESPLSISSPEAKKVVPQPQPSNPAVAGLSTATQLQLQNAKLLHIQTSTILEVPPNLAVIHIGKPNSQIPPDIDVSGFANSDVVSRIHADIRVEGDAYFIEDVGSSNGTYINHSPLLVGNRHRLRPGDCISLGKGDLVTFIFQLSE